MKIHHFEIAFGVMGMILGTSLFVSTCTPGKAPAQDAGADSDSGWISVGDDCRLITPTAVEGFRCFEQCVTRKPNLSDEEVIEEVNVCKQLCTGSYWQCP